MRKNINIKSLPEKLEISVSALGFYRFFVNGTELTKGILAPYISNPDHVNYYDTYDIAPYLKLGDNVLGFILGNGMKNCIGGEVWEHEKAAFRGAPAIAFSLELDGELITADESIKCHPSPITFDDLRMGCHYDARKEIADWCSPEYDDSGWYNACFAETARGEAVESTDIKIIEERELKAVSIKKARLDDTYACDRPQLYKNVEPFYPIEYDGYLYDFGENNAGVETLTLRNTKPGQVVQLQPCEYINAKGEPSYNNCFFYPDGFVQHDIYICKGADEESFTPSFTYHGFRYIHISGITEEQATEDALVYKVCHSEMGKRGGFSCSDEVLNSLYDMCRRSDLANFYYFPTDCPHREKQGWTGDVTVSCEHMLLEFTVEKLLAEFMRNVRASQKPTGAISCVVPTGGRGYGWGSGPIWDSILGEVPYQVYRYTGDKKILKDNATALMHYLQFAAFKKNSSGLVEYGLGDWVKPESELPTASVEFVDSVMIYALCCQALHIFGVLNMPLEMLYARHFARALHLCIRKKYIDNEAALANGGIMTAQVLALQFDLFDEDRSQAAADNLVKAIKENGDCHDCGMIGVRYLYHVLSRFGYADYAADLIRSCSPTGYGSFVESGLSTLPESFSWQEQDGNPKPWMSLNHHFLGDISHWFSESVAGIVVNPECDDASRVDVEPHFIRDIGCANAYFDNEYGRISVAWERIDANRIKLALESTNALHGIVTLPDGYVFENGKTQCDLKSGKFVVTK